MVNELSSPVLRHHGKCSVPGTAKQADHGKPDKATQLRSEGPSDDPSRRYCGTAEWNQATTTLPVHVPFQQYSVTERGGARYTITVLIKERSCLKKSNAGRHRQGVVHVLGTVSGLQLLLLCVVQRA